MQKRKQPVKRLFLSENFNNFRLLSEFSYLSPYNIDLDAMANEWAEVSPHEGIATYNEIVVDSIVWNSATIETIVAFVNQACISEEGRKRSRNFLAKHLKMYSASLLVDDFMFKSTDQCFEMLRISEFVEFMATEPPYRYMYQSHTVDENIYATLMIYQDTKLFKVIHDDFYHKMPFLNKALVMLKKDGLCLTVKPLTGNMTLKTLIEGYVKKYLPILLPLDDQNLLALHASQFKQLSKTFHEFADSGIQLRLKHLVDDAQPAEVIIYMGKAHAHSLFPDIVPSGFNVIDVHTTKHEFSRGGVKYYVFADLHTDDPQALDRHFKKYKQPPKSFMLEYYGQFLKEPTLEERIDGTAKDICDHIQYHGVKFKIPIDATNCVTVMVADLGRHGPLTNEICSGKFDKYFFTATPLFDHSSEISLCGVKAFDEL